MGRPRKRVDPNQLDLLDLLNRSRQVGLEIGAAMSRDLSGTRFSRAQVAQRMNAMLGEDLVTKSKLDCWTAPTKPLHRFPAEYMPAFVEATGKYEALRALVEACGCRLVVPERVRAELSRVGVERKRLERRERVLRVLAETDLKEVLG